MISWILRKTIFKYHCGVKWKEKYHNWCDGFTLINWNYDYKIDPQDDYLDIIRKWTQKNIKRWNYMLLVKYHEELPHEGELPIYDIYFRKKSDALKFKLTWG